MTSETKKLISNLKEELRDSNRNYLEWSKAQAKLKGIEEGIEALKKDIQNIEISCVGMPEEFIKGSDWAGGYGSLN